MKRPKIINEGDVKRIKTGGEYKSKQKRVRERILTVPLTINQAPRCMHRSRRCLMCRNAGF